MMNRIPLLLGCAVLTAAPAACTGPAALDGLALESFESGSVDLVDPHDWISLEKQPTAAELEQASKDGVQTVINLRPSASTPDSTSAPIVTGLGMHTRISRSGAQAELTDDIFEESRALLRDAERPILLHCASANRVGRSGRPT